MAVRKKIVKEAVQILIEALKTDEAYRESWKANIAIAFKDEYNRAEYRQDHDKLEGHISELDIHEIANIASDNFLNLLCQ